MCARFLSYLLLLYIGRVHGANSGCTDLGDVHHVSAQNKSLISDTVRLSSNKKSFPVHRPGGLKRAYWNFFSLFSKKSFFFLPLPPVHSSL